MRKWDKMEDNLKQLLEAEREVNNKVKRAMEHKLNLLSSIKQQAENDLQNFRDAQASNYNKEYEQLRRRVDAEGKDAKVGADLD